MDWTCAARLIEFAGPGGIATGFRVRDMIAAVKTNLPGGNEATLSSPYRNS